MNITQVALGNIGIESTTFGTLDLNKLSELLNLGIGIGLPYFNTWLEGQKVQIPNELFGLFKLTDLTIKYHDNYLEAGLTPTFEMPKENIEGIYEQFVPFTEEEVTQDEDYYVSYSCIEQIDENNHVFYSHAPNHICFASFYTQVRIFFEELINVFIY